MPLSLAAIPIQTLIAIGAVVGMMVVGWSYANWRAAVKAAFVLAILEGAIRKWMLPQANELVYFGKDMLLAGAYLRFFLSPDPELRAWRLVVPGTAIAACSVMAGIAAFNPNIGHPLMMVIGLKAYFMYVPLIFLMPFLFRSKEELVRQLTWFAMLATPVCLLGFLQWKSDRFSVLNTFAHGMLEDGATGFGFGDKARITGTFSYITGHTTFVVMFATLHIALLMCDQPKWKRLWLMGNLPLLLANGFMGGSRSAIYGIIVVAAGYLATATIYKLGPNQKKVFTTLIIGGAISVTAAAIWSADALLMWKNRVKHSEDNIQSRVIDTAKVSFGIVFNEVGIMGYGLGTTLPVSGQMRNRLQIPPPAKKPPAMDHEMMQIMVELGLVSALAWYGLRIVLLMHSITLFKASAPSGLRAIYLGGIFIQVLHLYMSVVLNHTASILTWGWIGICFIPALQPAVMRRHPVAAPRVASPHSNPFRRGSKVR